MFKKAQAAMEFLVTYGWAILVVLAAVGALFYFGVLTPSKFAQESCFLPGGLVCIDQVATTSSISIVLQNSAGFDMANISVKIEGESASGAAELVNGAKSTYSTTSTYTSGKKLKGNFQVAYTNVQSGLTHTKTGDIVVEIP